MEDRGVSEARRWRRVSGMMAMMHATRPVVKRECAVRSTRHGVLLAHGRSPEASQRHGLAQGDITRQTSGLTCPPALPHRDPLPPKQLPPLRHRQCGRRSGHSTMGWK
jgi:hypothetical protein